ncbi:MAG TPA: alginate export family protein, partial [Gemmataceae bacterium]
MASSRYFRKWAGVGVIAGLLWTGTQARTEEPPSPAGAAAKDTTPKDAAAPPAVANPPVSSDLVPTCAGVDGAADGPKSIFANVPPIPQVLPKPGVFFLPPQGPGYYSLWDVLMDKYRDKRPPQPYSAVSPDIYPFFNANFFYLDKPDAEWQSPSDAFKRVRIGDELFMLSFGGEERIRQVNEVNSRLSGKDNNYQLLRSRVYGDLWFEDKVRVYVEYIDAQTFNQNLPPAPIDVNKSDLLNAFIDLKLMDIDGSPVYVRGGRQELCFGSQRLISPLDWANTLRTFNGVQMFRYSEKFDASAFWTQPIIINPTRFDSVDDKQNFSGLWLTERPVKNQAIDLYYLNLDNDNHNVLGQAVGGTRVRGSFNTSTFGTRYAGNQGDLLFDFEGMYQFGPWSNQNTSAGAYTSDVGWNFSKLPMTPQFWVGYDFAAGDHHPGTTDTHGTFNQLFPFGHYYFGFLDLVGRMN